MSMAMTTVLPEPVAILAQRRSNAPPSVGTNDSYLVGIRRFTEPNQRLRGLKLAKEETPRLKLLLVIPVLKQPPGNACYARIAFLAPSSHTRPDLVDQWNLNKLARIIERLGCTGGHHVARGSAAIC